MDNEHLAESKQLSSGEIGAFIQELKEKWKISNDLLALVKRDLEYGYSREMVETYVKTGWGFDRISKFSEIIGKTSDEEFISYIQKNQFSARQMGTLLEFHLKHISVTDMIEVTGQGMSEFATHKVLSELAEAKAMVKDAKNRAEVLAGDDKKSQEIIKKISEMISGIGDNRDFLQKVLTKLEQLDTIQKNGDDVKESLADTIETQEALITEQQSKLNQQAKELAQKNAKIESLMGEIESFLSEKEKFQRERDEFIKDKTVITSERDSAREEAENLRREKEEMKRKMEELQKKKETHTQETDKREADGFMQKRGRMPDCYQTKVTSNGKAVQNIEVERMTRKNPDGLLALAGKKLFKGRNRINLISHLKKASLNQAQMKQVKAAIEAGLTEDEVIDIINSGFDADEMAQAVEIVLAEKIYSQEGAV